MRQEEQVIRQILDFAAGDNNTRAVLMNGSIVNPKAPKDIMQDYDVVFFVSNLEDLRYKKDRSWINQFGELVMLQQNDGREGRYVFLMQFKDGVRIDLSFDDIKRVNEAAKEDSLTRILFDKDGVVNELPSPDDSTYHVKKPSREEFDETLNEVWWIQAYVAKGIWRDELPYVKYMFDVHFLECIRKLLEWHIGMQYGWQVNTGKCGKWLKNFLDRDTYKEFISLYSASDYEEIWEALFKAGPLIRGIGAGLASGLGYEYPMKYDINMSEYIRKIKKLPPDAADFR